MCENVEKSGVKGLRKVVLGDGDHVPMLGFADRIVEICLEAAGE
jgi:hypothetical protein